MQRAGAARERGRLRRRWPIGSVRALAVEWPLGCAAHPVPFETLTSCQHDTDMTNRMQSGNFCRATTSTVTAEIPPCVDIDLRILRVRVGRQVRGDLAREPWVWRSCRTPSGYRGRREPACDADRGVRRRHGGSPVLPGRGRARETDEHRRAAPISPVAAAGPAPTGWPCDPPPTLVPARLAPGHGRPSRRKHHAGMETEPAEWHVALALDDDGGRNRGMLAQERTR